MNHTNVISELGTWFSVWGLGIAGGAELLELNKPAVCPLRAPAEALKARLLREKARPIKPA